MSGSILDVSPAVLDVLALPPLDGLRDEQVRGAACVWCGDGPLNAETAIDLGEQMSTLQGSPSPRRWYPRACRRCIAGRAYEVLFDHAPDCDTCRTNAAGCEIGHALRRLALEGQR